MLTKDQLKQIKTAKTAAIKILLHNSKGPFEGLPRTAGWGYPEPYTRDLLFSTFGIAVSDDKRLHSVIKKVLETLGKNQTEHGHIPSIVSDPANLGASDTTPLFLVAIGIYRKMTGCLHFLEKETNSALNWMEYQSPSDQLLIAQQPTSDWRDEQWILGYGLYVNTLYHFGLRLLGENERANRLASDINEHLTSADPYYAIWSFKQYNSNKFDLLGNSLAILSGIASLQKANDIISWVENSCQSMIADGLLAIDLPPNFFPFIYPDDHDWHNRYEIYNLPGDYHNGGIWPFICAMYIAALVYVEKFELAEKKLVNLTLMIQKARDPQLSHGFNEWNKSQSALPSGQDWQTWSAALYLYAAKCVEMKHTFF